MARKLEHPTTVILTGHVPGSREPVQIKVEAVVKQQFNVGDFVCIIDIVPQDTMTTQDIVGHWGVVEEFDEGAWPLAVNYTIKCYTCTSIGATHYMHQEELMPYTPPTVFSPSRAVTLEDQ